MEDMYGVAADSLTRPVFQLQSTFRVDPESRDLFSKSFRENCHNQEFLDVFWDNTDLKTVRLRVARCLEGGDGNKAGKIIDATEKSIRKNKTNIGRIFQHETACLATRRVVAMMLSIWYVRYSGQWDNVVVAKVPVPQSAVAQL